MTQNKLPKRRLVWPPILTANPLFCHIHPYLKASGSKQRCMNSSKYKTRLQKEFINTAAHELRTPIQPILGITDILKGSVTDDRHKELLDVIGRNAKRLKKLSENILEVSKIESNSMGLDKEHFRIVETILDNINSLQKQHRWQKHKV